MTDLLTPGEARQLFQHWLTHRLDPPYPAQETIEQYLTRKHGYHDRRLKQAAQRLADLYSGDIPAAQLVPFEAGEQWAITPYGLLCLDEPGYRLERAALFDRHLLAHMAGKGWVRMVEFACCLFYARAYVLAGE